MDCIVCVILLTTPLLTPKLLALPIPKTSSFPYSFLRPIIATILVVPISKPTAILLFSISIILYQQLDCDI